MWNPFQSESRGEGNLERAIAATRRTASRQPATLAPVTRARILEAAHRGLEGPVGHSAPFPALFAGQGRLFFAGALPLLLAVGLVLLLDDATRTPPGVGSRVVASRVMASKDADQIHFQIANGGRPHRVLRSRSPKSFDPGSAVTVRDGAYSDSLEGSGDLVFYRIE